MPKSNSFLITLWHFVSAGNHAVLECSCMHAAALKIKKDLQALAAFLQALTIQVKTH